MTGAARITVLSALMSLCLAVSAPAQGVDLSKLPRVAGAKVVYAGPTSAIYTAPGSVEQAAAATVQALAAAGWQHYGNPFAQSAENAQQRIMTFKKGPEGITAFVSLAPQGVTNVSYTANPLSNDLPFPPDGSEIGFAPERPHLRALSGKTVTDVLAFYRTEMPALGYRAWTGKPEQVSDTHALVFFTRDETRILVVSLSRNDAGKTRVDISPTTARVLTTPSQPTAQTETPEQAQARAAARDAHERASSAIDAQINAQIGQVMRDVQQAMRAPQAPGAAPPAAPAIALQPLKDNTAPVPLPSTASNVDFDGEKGELEFDSASDVRSLAAFHADAMRKDGWSTRRPTIDRDNMVVQDFTKAGKTLSLTIMRFGQGARVRASGSGLVTAAASAPATAKASAATAAPAQQFSAEDLTVEEVAGYPVPKRRTASESERTQYRVALNATVPMDVATTLDFYRRELTKRGWTEGQGAQVSAERASVSFTAPDGPATLALERKQGNTAITLALRKPEVARKAGVLPRPGQAKVLIGNPNDSEAAVTINKQTFRVKPGAGAKNPDGPMVDLPPGKYQVTLKMGGVSANETIEVGADETWGVLAGPGGLLPLRVY